MDSLLAYEMWFFMFADCWGGWVLWMMKHFVVSSLGLLWGARVVGCWRGLAVCSCSLCCFLLLWVSSNHVYNGYMSIIMVFYIDFYVYIYN